MMTTSTDVLAARAAELDAADPLRSYRDLFIGADDLEVVAYLDGNSLGRPTKASAERINGPGRRHRSVVYRHTLLHSSLHRAHAGPARSTSHRPQTLHVREYADRQTLDRPDAG